MACSSGGRPARRRAGRALHQPEECATSLFHQTRDTTLRGERITDQVTTFESAFGVSLDRFAEEFANYLATLVRRDQ
jgi:hypothetical protein